MLAAVVALISCSKEGLDPVNVDEPAGATAITFNLNANHPEATKAVKSGWENGDVIFVFFSGAAAPKHLKMTYNGSSWTSEEYNGSEHIPGALGLENGATGTMRAVFLPFGSDATVSASGTSFTFSTTYYAYYLTATLDYTVTNNTVSGAFDMTIPSGYVQFFVEDENATDGAYTLGTDPVKPVGIASIAANGNITEASLSAGADMVGYAYQGGYLFSGKFTSWSYGKNYYFYKTKASDGSRADLFVQPANALASHSAVKLPANNSDRWIAVGANITVTLRKSDNTSLGTWYTCNYGCTAPEQLGTLSDFATANANATLPTKTQFETLSDKNKTTITTLKVHGQEGYVLKASGGTGFLFLAKNNGEAACYWASTSLNDAVAYYLNITGSGAPTAMAAKTRTYGVRPIAN